MMKPLLQNQSLGFDLKSVLHVLPLAAAAGAKVRAWRDLAVPGQA